MNEKVWEGDCDLCDKFIKNDLSKLSGYTRVAGCLTLAHVGAKEINSLTDLKKIDGDLLLESCTKIENMWAFKNIESAAGIFIYHCPALTSLDGLQKIKELGDLKIHLNGGLINLGGLKIQRILKDLTVTENDALRDLTGLESLTSVGDFIDIKDNDSLTDISGLRNLMSSGGLCMGSSSGKFPRKQAEDLRDKLFNSGGLKRNSESFIFTTIEEVNK